MDAKKTRLIVAASVAGLMAVAGTPWTGAVLAEGEAHCYGINKCKGTGECGGKGHSCAGKNACKGQGWLPIADDLCLKIDGGRLTAEPEES